MNVCHLQTFFESGELALQVGEVITGLRIPDPPAGSQAKCYRVGKGSVAGPSTRSPLSAASNSDM